MQFIPISPNPPKGKIRNLSWRSDDMLHYLIVNRALRKVIDTTGKIFLNPP